MRGVDQTLLGVIERAAEELGANLRITDGKRGKNPGYGAEGSLHKLGRAADIGIKELGRGMRGASLRTINALGAPVGVHVENHTGNKLATGAHFHASIGRGHHRHGLG
jgi:hypothetical protein